MMCTLCLWALICNCQLISLNVCTPSRLASSKLPSEGLLVSSIVRWRGLLAAGSRSLAKLSKREVSDGVEAFGLREADRGGEKALVLDVSLNRLKDIGFGLVKLSSAAR